MTVSSERMPRYEQWRGLLFGLVAFVCLLCLATQLRNLVIQERWEDQRYELATLVAWVAFVGANWVLLHGLFAFARIRSRIVRILPTLFFAAVGFRVGTHYIRGSDTSFDYLIVIAVPTVAAATFALCRKPKYGYFVAVTFLIMAWLLAPLYWAWCVAA